MNSKVPALTLFAAVSLFAQNIDSVTALPDETASKKESPAVYNPVVKPKSENPAPEKKSSYAEISQKRYQNYVGGCAGVTTGYGLSWRHWGKSQKNGFQITLFPWYDRDSLSGETYYSNRGYDYNSFENAKGTAAEGKLSAGGTWLHSLIEGRYLRFISYASSHVKIDYQNNDFTYDNYLYNYDYYGSHSDTTSGVNSDYQFEKSVYLGGGLGMEIFIWRLSLSPMAGFMGMRSFTSGDMKVGPTGEFALHIRF